MANQVKTLFESDKFKLAFDKIAEQAKLSEDQSQLALNIFEKLLLAEIDYYDLAYELEQGIKIDFDTSINLSEKIYELYNDSVPQEIKTKVEARIQLNESLVELEKVQSITIEQLNSNYKQGKKFFKNNNLPDLPDKVYISPEIISINEQEDLINNDHNLKTSEFSSSTGLLLNRDTKIRALGYTLRDKGLPESQTVDYARKFVAFVEAQQKYRYAQKSLQKDILEELGLINVAGDKAVKWNHPKELNKISQAKKLQIKDAAFKILNLLQAYTVKVSAKNAVIDQVRVDEYKSFLQIYIKFLAEDSLNKQELKIIANNLVVMMIEIESGTLLISTKE